MKPFTTLSLLALSTFASAKDAFILQIAAPGTPLDALPITISATTTPAPLLSLGINNPGESIGWSEHSSGREIRAETGGRSNKFQATLYGPAAGPLTLAAMNEPKNLRVPAGSVNLWQSWVVGGRDASLRVTGGPVGGRWWAVLNEGGLTWGVVFNETGPTNSIPVDVITHFT